jgi:cell fate (sporulation/competence/biofilm development) regulator YlbF (YheA/YmcA/DUF963 family)
MSEIYDETTQFFEAVADSEEFKEMLVAKGLI